MNILTAADFDAENPQPGIYRDLPNEVYHRCKGFSKTSLSRILKSPALRVWAREAPRSDSDAEIIGNAVHTRVLEAGEFSNRYALAPVCDRRTKEGKRIYADFVASVEDQKLQVLSADEFEQISDMSGSILAHPEAKSFLMSEGYSELSFFWIDEATGLLCKCRADRFSTEYMLPADVKTVDRIERFKWSVLDLDYDMQAAFYMWGISQCLGIEVARFPFIVCGKTREMGQYPTHVYELSDQMLMVGATRFREALDIAYACLESGQWPGIETIDVERKY